MVSTICGFTMRCEMRDETRYGDGHHDVSRDIRRTGYCIIILCCLSISTDALLIESTLQLDG